MMSKMKKRLVYGLAALLLLFFECLIAQMSGFVRYTVGDLLVVMLIYAAVRVLFPNRPKPIYLAIGVLIFAICVELSQFFNLIGLLGLSGERAAHLTIGSTFDWGDIAAYLTGCALAWGLDALFCRRNQAISADQ